MTDNLTDDELGIKANDPVPTLEEQEETFKRLWELADALEVTADIQEYERQAREAANED